MWRIEGGCCDHEKRGGHFGTILPLLDLLDLFDLLEKEFVTPSESAPPASATDPSSHTCDVKLN